MPNVNQPLFSILHTSVRPHEWGKVYKAWLDATHDPDRVEYVLVVDHDWGFDNLPTLRPQDTVMWAKGTRHCYVEGVNLAAHNSTGKVLIVNADDQYPCDGWDEELIEVILEANGWDHEGAFEKDFIILPSTGTLDEHIRRIAVMPILSRTRYNKLHYVLYPLYESMFADNDFLAHARKDNCVIEAKHLMFPHRHPFNEGIPTDQWDDAYKAQGRQQAYQLGSAIFEARQNSKFDDTVAVQESRPAYKPKLVMCLPGESYSQEWVTQWTEILCQLSQFFQMIPLFSWCTNVYTTRESLAKAAQDAQADFIVWIDDDNLVAPGQIVTLINHLLANQVMDIVAGWCWLRSGLYTVIDLVSAGYFDGVKARPMTYGHLMSGPDDLVPVEFTGFPVVAMRGNTLDHLPKFPFRPILSDDYPYGHSGEDVGFCYRAKEARLSIFVDRTVKVPHLKRKPDEPAALPATSHQPVEAVAAGVTD
jgi:hypothetical protein